MHTLVNILSFFSSPEKDDDPDTDRKIINIAASALISKMAQTDVPFRGKKVFIDWKNIVPEDSVISKSEEGGYVRSGLAIRLPELGRYLRFFCFWNDLEKRIDLDLHATAIDVNDEVFSVGWDGDYCNGGIVFSGDITTSIDSAEYIDIDLESDTIKKVNCWIHSYTEVPFKDISECFTGMMAVSELGQKTDTKLYNGKNVIWSHHLSSEKKTINYGTIDLQKKELILCANTDDREFRFGEGTENIPGFNLRVFIESYIQAVNGEITYNKEEADIVLTPYKTERENEISILDNNFFLDEKNI